MNRAVLLAIALVLATALGALVFVSTRESSALNWKSSFDDALQAARSGQRHMVAYLYTDWCTYCKQMEAETFSDPRVQAQANRYVWLKLNPEKDADGARLHKQYEVAGYPTIIVFDRQGRRIAQVEGFLPPEEFLNELVAMTVGPDSLPALEDRAAHDPKSGEAQYALGSKYLDMNEYGSAAEAFGKAIALDPDNRDRRTELGYYHLAVSLASDHRYDQANAALDRFTKLYPDSQLAPDALILRAQVYFHQQQWAQSSETFELFLNKYPNHEKASLVRRMLAEVREQMPLLSSH